MDPAHVSNIITGVIGILGVIIGNAFVAIKEWVVTHRKNSKDAAYLAILVVSHLDRFANGCMHVAFDDGTDEGRPASDDGVSYEPTVRVPEFAPLDINVEWKVLPKDLMYEILQIPDKQENIQNRLAGIWGGDGPDYTDFFWTRQRDYAALGLHVSAVARKLRKHAGMPLEEPAPGEWSRDAAMREVVEKIDEKREAWRKRMAESASSFFAEPTDARRGNGSREGS